MTKHFDCMWYALFGLLHYLCRSRALLDRSFQYVPKTLLCRGKALSRQVESAGHSRKLPEPASSPSRPQSPGCGQYTPSSPPPDWCHQSAGCIGPHMPPPFQSSQTWPAIRPLRPLNCLQVVANAGCSTLGAPQDPQFWSALRCCLATQQPLTVKVTIHSPNWISLDHQALIMSAKSLQGSNIQHVKHTSHADALQAELHVSQSRMNILDLCSTRYLQCADTQTLVRAVTAFLHVKSPGRRRTAQ